MNGVDEADLVVGVDTHLDTHTAAICDARGRAVSQLQVPATTPGYGSCCPGSGQQPRDRQVVWAVEGTRHYGLGLARYLAAKGQQVSEIDCSRHVGKRRAGRATPSTPSGPPANYSPGPGLRRCAPMGTVRRCGC